MRLGLNLQHAKELHQTASCVTFSFRIYQDFITELYMKIDIISQNLIGTYMKTNWPNRCLLFVSSKFLQGIESLRIKTKSFKSCWGLWVSTICCRAGAALGQKFLKELRNFQKSFDNFRNELQKWCCLKRRKTDNIFRFIAPVLCVISLSCCFQITELKLLCEEVSCLTCDRKSTLFTKVDLHASCFTGSMISSSFPTWILVVSMLRIGKLHFWRNHCFIFLILFLLQLQWDHFIILFTLTFARVYSGANAASFQWT